MHEPLDLKLMADLEREMPRIHGHVWITQEHVDYIGDNLRPLLDLVERMGKALENTPCGEMMMLKTTVPYPICKAMYPENPGRWCNRCRGLEYYRLAGGE